MSCGVCWGRLPSTDDVEPKFYFLSYFPEHVNNLCGCQKKTQFLFYKQMQEENAFNIKFWLFDPNHSLIYWVFDKTFKENIVLICLLLSWKGDSFGDSCVVCPADLDCLPGKPREFSFDPLPAKSGQSHFLFSCLTVVSSFAALAGTSAGTFWESNTTISYPVHCPLDC